MCDHGQRIGQKLTMIFWYLIISCDVGEYLDYKNCKCRKKIVNKLVEECTETVKEVKLPIIALADNKNKSKCSSCTVYIVLFSIIFTINIGITTYFVYSHWYLKKDATRVMFGTNTQTTIYWTYKWEKLNKLTFRIKLIIFTTTWLISKILNHIC